MTLEITDDEALVLYHLLSKYGEADVGRQLTIQFTAERNALWALSAALDKQLVASFQMNYDEQLSAARARVEKRGGSW